MQGFLKGLDMETQLLVALGAAVASGCEPCLQTIVDQARQAEVDAKKLKSAAIIGQFVKDQPAVKMRALADQLLGTHLSSQPAQCGCPAEAG